MAQMEENGSRHSGATEPVQTRMPHYKWAETPRQVRLDAKHWLQDKDDQHWWFPVNPIMDKQGYVAALKRGGDRREADTRLYATTDLNSTNH